MLKQSVVVVAVLVLMVSTVNATVQVDIVVNGYPIEYFEDYTFTYGDQFILTLSFDDNDNPPLVNIFDDAVLNISHVGNEFGNNTFSGITDFIIDDDNSGGVNIQYDYLAINPSPLQEMFSYDFGIGENHPVPLIIDAVSGDWNGIQAVPGASDGLPYIEIRLVPEPFTLSLLALGTLMLKRKKI